MPPPPKALRAQYEAVREPLLHALEGLTDEQMLEPSLDGWSVKDHLVLWWLPE